MQNKVEQFVKQSSSIKKTKENKHANMLKTSFKEGKNCKVNEEL